MKKKSISDYITNWHKAIIALIFFISAGVWFVALAGEVKQHTQEIEKINIWRLNEKIWYLEDVYNCEEVKCRDKMPKEIWEDYRDKLEERKSKYEGIAK